MESNDTYKVKTNGKIKLVSGRYLSVFEPHPEDIDLIDIAYGLSHTCRFTGQLPCFYSVAQHSVRVSQIVPIEYALEGLLHDASEAYLTDIPRPIKERMPEYRSIEDTLMQAICHRFHPSCPISPIVKEADEIALWEEMESLRGPEVLAEVWSPQEAWSRFLARYQEITRVISIPPQLVTV